MGGLMTGYVDRNSLSLSLSLWPNLPILWADSADINHIIATASTISQGASLPRLQSQHGGADGRSLDPGFHFHFGHFQDSTKTMVKPQLPLPREEAPSALYYCKPGMGGLMFGSSQQATFMQHSICSRCCLLDAGETRPYSHKHPPAF